MHDIFLFLLLLLLNHTQSYSYSQHKHNTKMYLRTKNHHSTRSQQTERVAQFPGQLVSSFPFPFNLSRWHWSHVGPGLSVFSGVSLRVSCDGPPMKCPSLKTVRTGPVCGHGDHHPSRLQGVGVWGGVGEGSVVNYRYD